MSRPLPSPAQRIAALLRDAPAPPTPRELDALVTACQRVLGNRQRVLVRFVASSQRYVADHYDGAAWTELQPAPPVPVIKPVDRQRRLQLLRSRHRRLTAGKGR